MCSQGGSLHVISTKNAGSSSDHPGWRSKVENVGSISTAQQGLVWVHVESFEICLSFHHAATLGHRIRAPTMKHPNWCRSVVIRPTGGPSHMSFGVTDRPVDRPTGVGRSNPMATAGVDPHQKRRKCLMVKYLMSETELLE